MRLANPNDAPSASKNMSSPVLLAVTMPSPQVVDDQPTEQEENYHSTPENPLVLLRSPLDHAYCIATNTQGVCNGVQPPLCALEHVPLLPQIAQHRSSSV